MSGDGGFRRARGAWQVPDDAPLPEEQIRRPDDPTAEIARLRGRLIELWLQTKALLDALEAQEPERICVAIGALMGRPAGNPHDWLEWCQPYAAVSGRMVQMRRCVHCGDVEYRDAVPEPPSLTDCDPGDEQP